MITLFQKLPDDIIYEVRQFIIYKPKTKQELEDAIIIYNRDIEKCNKIYGDISIWDTSLITDMSKLFKDMIKFNGDISRWNTSNVTDMSYMFCGASLFN